jgi:phosphotransferase system  glucose/maltose/N-acetylglucosamine-specific IIC component
MIIFKCIIQLIKKCGGKNIRDKLFVIPGYLTGLGCLLIITYRTLIAFFSEGKSIIININSYGEQYVDIIALVVIWIICIIGFYFLIKKSKQEEKSNEFNYNLNKEKNIIAFLPKSSDKKKS